MQVSDYFHTQLFNTPKSLQVALSEIVDRVNISEDFSITHPDYQPYQLPAEVVTYYQQLPLEIQNQYLRIRLCDFLYGIYYNGSLKTALDSADILEQRDLDNKTYLGIDREFYQRLQTSNHGTGYLSPGWLVLEQESPRSLTVNKEGLTLQIDREIHLQLAERFAQIGDSVKILLPSNQIESDYYIAIANAGFPHNLNLDRQTQIVSVYFNLSPEGSVAVMDSLTRQLNAIAIPFTFQVLYNPSDYDCYDSGILTFLKSDYQGVRDVLRSIYLEHQSNFRPEVPLFTKILAPGLALAEEPERKFFEGDNFGRNRCEIVTNGLLVARQQGDESPQRRMIEIIEQFSLMEIELQHTYLNPQSEDIYIPLDLGTPLEPCQERRPFDPTPNL